MALNASSTKIPILIDTDIGNDIDDAVALAYLLRHPRAQILGITTVTGDVQKRAAIAEVIIRAAGLSPDSIPIHCGRRDPLLKGVGQPDVPGYAVLKDLNIPYRMDRPENTAAGFLREKILQSEPGTVTLLTIGPMSNIALLFALDPNIPARLNAVYSMAGAFSDSKKQKEWNMMVDTTAAAMVYNPKTLWAEARHTTIPVNVTTQCTMDKEEVFRRFAELPEPMPTVGKIAHSWLGEGGRKKLVFHDPLAAAAIFEPKLCEYKVGTVTADGDSGRTTLEEGPGRDHVACSVDVGRFFAHFFDVVDK